MNTEDVKTGIKVHYTSDEGVIENGIIKSFEKSKRLIYVVYNCDNEWERYYDYTGSMTYIDDLTLGWVNDEVNSKLENMNLKKIFERKKLILEILNKVKDSKTITGIAILNAITGRRFSDEEVLRYVQDQATDSFKTMSNCIGEELATKILQIKL